MGIYGCKGHKGQRIHHSGYKSHDLRFTQPLTCVRKQTYIHTCTSLPSSMRLFTEAHTLLLEDSFSHRCRGLNAWQFCWCWICQWWALLLCDWNKVCSAHSLSLLSDFCNYSTRPHLFPRATDEQSSGGWHAVAWPSPRGGLVFTILKALKFQDQLLLNPQHQLQEDTRQNHRWNVSMIWWEMFIFCKD